VRKYEAWRARTNPGADGELSAADRRRLEHWRAQERNEAIYRRAMRMAEIVEGPATATREGNRGEASFREESKRDQHGVVARFLRLALKASDTLLALAESPPPPAPPGNAQIDDRQVFQRLAELRDEAEEAGRVPRSEAIYWTVESWLRALKGQRQASGAPETYLPGTPLAELARSILSRGEVEAAPVSSGEQASGEPEQANGEPEQASGEPEQASGGPEQASGGREPPEANCPATRRQGSATGNQELGTEAQASSPSVRTPEMHNCISPPASASLTAKTPCGAPATALKKGHITRIAPGEAPRELTVEEGVERLKERKRLRLATSSIVAGAVP